MEAVIARRGCWLGLLFAPCVAFGAHPLFSDDTLTQGAGGWQLEINSDRSIVKYDAQVTLTHLAATTLTYGVSDPLDVALTLPYQNARVGEREPFSRAEGIGDVVVGCKWQAWSRGIFSLALKPELSLPTGNAALGLGNGRGSVSLGVLGMASLKNTSFLLNTSVIYNANTLAARTRLWSTSAAAITAVTPSVRVVLDLGAFQDPDPGVHVAPSFVIAGLIWSPNADVDVDIGYRRGINKADLDHTWGAGLTLRWR